MKMMTSAYAHKLLKSLDEEKTYWVNKERTSSIYTSGINETPIIPEYDYSDIAAKITDLDQKIRSIKHAINLANATAKIDVSGSLFSVDTILMEMAQLNKRKDILDYMRKQLPQIRVIPFYGVRNAVPEYQYINYDLEKVKADFDRVSDRIMTLQMALDFYNQTVQFEVDID